MNYQSILLLPQRLGRQQSSQPLANVIKSGIGGLLTIAVLAWISQYLTTPWLMAPFGASCVLLFSVPASPLSQPANVFWGHVVSTGIGLILHEVLPVEWWSLGLAVGLAIAIMAYLKVTHPPAGADPLVVFFTSPGWDYLVFPVMAGCLLMIVIAWLFHLLPPSINYPVTAPINNSKPEK